MSLSLLDYGIIMLYFVCTAGIALYAYKKAAGSIDHYFLGGRSIPWYLLAMSGFATYLDMSGTMLQTSFFYMMGVKGYWVCYRGAICLTLSFAMIFMAKWHRRSHVMTNAELMEFRFGSGMQGETARVLSAASVLILVVAFIAYYFIGSAKFLGVYIPIISPEICSLLMFVVVLIYCATGGFFGVVYTDVFQGLLILSAMVYVLFKAWSVGTPEYYTQFASGDWLALAPRWEMDMPKGYESMHHFGALVIIWLILNIVQGFAMPIDSWSSQKLYSAKDEREGALLAFQWIVLMCFRFFMMMGVGVLAIGIAGKISEPEMVLPAVINHYFPSGAKGLVIAALLAAQISTIDAALNSSTAYFINDIYKKYLVPKANKRHLVKASYLTSVIIVVVGVIIGWQLPNINSIWAWIIMGLLTGIVPPNILKWFWWRFNGMGYTFGMISGMLAATIQSLMFPNIPELDIFLFIFAISTIGSIIGVFCGKPTDDAILVRFYRTIRPFGFWGPIKRQCLPEFVAGVRKENHRDLWLLIPAAVFQLTLYWTTTAMVVKNWHSVAFSIVVLIVTLLILYKFWYKNLEVNMKNAQKEYPTIQVSLQKQDQIQC